METIRSFIAIEIPARIQAEIGELQNRLKRSGGDVKWVEPRNIHLTLRFLGHVPPEKIEEMKKALPESLAGTNPYDLKLSGLGAFPNQRRPRVVWIGLEKGTEESRQIQERVESCVERLGFAREERAFTPHITIGRVRSQKNLDRLAMVLSQEVFSAENFPVSQIVLMRSDLKPTGPMYSHLGELRFH